MAPFVYKCFVPGIAQWLSRLKLSVLSRIILISITNLPKNISSTPQMTQPQCNEWVGGCRRPLPRDNRLVRPRHTTPASPPSHTSVERIGGPHSTVVMAKGSASVLITPPTSVHKIACWHRFSSRLSSPTSPPWTRHVKYQDLILKLNFPLKLHFNEAPTAQ